MLSASERWTSSPPAHRHRTLPDANTYLFCVAAASDSGHPAVVLVSDCSFSRRLFQEADLPNGPPRCDWPRARLQAFISECSGPCFLIRLPNRSATTRYAIGIQLAIGMAQLRQAFGFCRGKRCRSSRCVPGVDAFNALSRRFPHQIRCEARWLGMFLPTAVLHVGPDIRLD